MTEEKVKKPRTSWYVNSTTYNIFIDTGRLAPGEKVFLSPQKARLYKGLTLCKSR